MYNREFLNYSIIDLVEHWCRLERQTVDLEFIQWAVGSG